MWKLLTNEIRYNWYAFAIGALISAIISIVVIFAGEDNWRGPSLVLFAIMIVSSASINVHFAIEKRYLTFARLPLKPSYTVAIYPIIFLLIIAAITGTSLLIVAVAKPDIISKVTFARLLIAASAMMGGFGFSVLGVTIGYSIKGLSQVARVIAGLPFMLIGFVFFLFPNSAFFVSWATSGDYHSSKTATYSWQSSLTVVTVLFLIALLAWAAHIMLYSKRRTFFSK